MEAAPGKNGGLTYHQTLFDGIGLPDEPPLPGGTKARYRWTPVAPASSMPQAEARQRNGLQAAAMLDFPWLPVYPTRPQI